VLVVAVIKNVLGERHVRVRRFVIHLLFLLSLSLSPPLGAFSSTFLWRFFLSALCNKCDVNTTTGECVHIKRGAAASKRVATSMSIINNDTCER